MEQYEYVVKINSGSGGDLQDLLNELGADGFRLVGFVSDRGTGTGPYGGRVGEDTVILERPKPKRPRF